MNKAIKLKTPLSEKDVRGLNVGDSVEISGVVYTARDAAHKYLIEKATPETLGFNLEGGILYHCGPVVSKETDGLYNIVAAGPTTSSRLSVYEPQVIEKYGVRAVIGKGGMDDSTLEAFSKHRAVYLSAVGGAAVVLANAVKKVRGVYMLEEFGVPEAVWELEVENLPTIVTMDSHRQSIHKKVLEDSGREYHRILGL